MHKWNQEKYLRMKYCQNANCERSEKMSSRSRPFIWFKQEQQAVKIQTADINLQKMPDTYANGCIRSREDVYMYENIVQE